MTVNKSLDPLPYFKWLWRDWRANRRVQRMNYIARGLYRELLDEQWSEGSIPNELSELADICGCPTAVMDEHWEEIRQYFYEREDGRLVNPKMESQRTEQDQRRVRLADAGRAGAISKLLKIQDDAASAELMLASAEPVPYSRAVAEHTQEHKQEHVDFPNADEKDTDTMNAITEIKKLTTRIMGIDQNIWDSDKAKIREYVIGHGGTYVSRVYEDWAVRNAGIVRKNPVGEFLKVAPGLFAGTFSPSGDREVIDLTRELTFLSGRVVVFDDKQKAGVAGLIRNGNHPDEITEYFKEFFHNLDTSNPKNVEFAAKKFVETADDCIYAKRKERVRKAAEAAAADRAREIMVAESVADREARKKAREAEEALVEDVLE